MTIDHITKKPEIMFLSYESCSATRKLPRLNSEPNGGGFDKEYEGGYGAKVSGVLASF